MVGIGFDSGDNGLMQTVTLDEAQKHLVELVRDLGRQGELLITDAERPVAKLLPATEQTTLRDLKPQSVGAILRPFPCPADDLLGEMLDARA